MEQNDICTYILIETDPNDYPHAEEAEADEAFVPNGETPPAANTPGATTKPAPSKAKPAPAAATTAATTTTTKAIKIPANAKMSERSDTWICGHMDMDI